MNTVKDSVVDNVVKKTAETVHNSEGKISRAFDFLVFIGRFQPFHDGHLAVVKEGLLQSEQMIILCGSAHQPRSVRNPWTVAEREAMIRATLSAEENARVHIAPLMDIVYNDESWVKNVQATVNGLATAHYSQLHKHARIGLIGHSKDNSSYYLNLFPQWQAVNVENHKKISATTVREKLLADIPFFETLPSDSSSLKAGSTDEIGSTGNTESEQVLQDMLPESVRHYLQKFCQTDAYDMVQEEYRFVAKYKSAWASSPYPPTFVTVDAVVVQSGHVLMVERKAKPGKGLLALPGGFVEHQEKLIDACLRELREETRLKVPVPVLKGSIKAREVFDDPYRSSRGRTVTHAFYIELAPNKELPKVKGGDDARHAIWVPLAELDPLKIFEDHYFIVQHMIGMS